MLAPDATIRGMTALLLIAIGCSLITVGLQMRAQRKFDRWAESQTRLWLAHTRLVNHVMRPAPPNWDDDRMKTRNLRHGETYLPVDFRHDLW